MRLLLAVLTICTAMLCELSAAQSSFNCNNDPPIAPLSQVVLTFAPAMPTTSDIVAIVVGVGEYDRPQPAVVTVQGSSLNITLSGHWLGGIVPPPRSCVATSVGPLRPGTYQANVFAI